MLLPLCPYPRAALGLIALALAANLSAQSPTFTDVPYGPAARNKLDLYLASSPNPTPLVVFYHSGGFVQGDKSEISATDLQYFLNAGISVVSVNYRFLEDPNVPLQDVLRDCARALQYVRFRASDWNINPYRVAIYGSSAGAMTSLWIATHPDLADPSNPDPVLRQSTRVVCAGTLTGQFSGDVEQWRAVFGSSTVEAFGGRYKSPGLYGFTQAADVYGPEGTAIRRSLDMYELISAQTPPIFVSNSLPAYPVLSTSQLLHDPRHARRIYDRCRERGVTVVANIEAYSITPSPGEPTSMRSFAAKYLSQPAPGEFLITLDAVPAAVVNRPFSPFVLTAQGGTPPYQWSLSSGTLPTGLSLASSGVLTGTPTQLGNYSFTVRAVDALGGSVTRTITQSVVTADQADLHFREDFETYLPGATATATWQLQTSVIDSTPVFGPGLALQINDSSATTASGYEVLLASSAADEHSRLRARFRLRNLAPAQTEPGALHFSMGRYSSNTTATLNANANRAFAIEFNRSGALNLRSNGAIQLAAFNTYDRAAVLNVELFANDHETDSVRYLRPDLGTAATLGPNRVIVFVNDAYFSEGPLHQPGGAGNATLGRLGFYSTQSDVINMAIDNVFVGSIPTPPAPVPFELLSMVQTEVGLELTYRLPPGHFYQLEYTDDLAAGNWAERGASLAGPSDGSPHTFYVEMPNPKGFYRVRQFTP